MAERITGARLRCAVRGRRAAAAAQGGARRGRPRDRLRDARVDVARDRRAHRGGGGRPSRLRGVAVLAQDDDRPGDGGVAALRPGLRAARWRRSRRTPAASSCAMAPRPSSSTDRTLAARARSLAGATCAVVEIDGDERPDPAFALPEVAPDALAYVLYTSGSTGSPKGVTQTQRGVMFFADAFVRRLSLGEADRLSLLWTMSFAAANMHVYGGLLNGATVCAYDLRRDGIGGLADWLDRERDHRDPRVPDRLPRTVRVAAAGREAPARARDRHRRGGDVRERRRALRGAHARRRDPGQPARRVRGRRASRSTSSRTATRRRGTPSCRSAAATPGVDVRIRRDDGSDAAVDEAGAIVVSQRARESRLLEAPRSRRAVPSPRSAASRAALLRERRPGPHRRRGPPALPRPRPAAASRSAATRSTWPRSRPRWPRRRASCVAPRSRRSRGGQGGRPDRRVRDRGDAGRRRRPVAELADRLPSYMLPSTFVFLDAFPTTSTGKVDRLALAKARARRRGAHRRRPPAQAAPDELELAVAGVFERLLRCRRTAARRRLLPLGGDSLLAVELLARLATRSGRTSRPPRHSTVAGIAAAIQRIARASAARAALRLLHALRAAGTCPAVHASGRLGQAPLVSPLPRAARRRPAGRRASARAASMARAASIDRGDGAHYVAEIRRVQPHGPYSDRRAMHRRVRRDRDRTHPARRRRDAACPTWLPARSAYLDRRFTLSESSTTDAAILRRMRAPRGRLRQCRRDHRSRGRESLGPIRARVRASDRAIRARAPTTVPSACWSRPTGYRAAPQPQWRKIYAGETVVASRAIAQAHRIGRRVPARAALDASTPRFAEALAKAMRRVYRDFAEGLHRRPRARQPVRTGSTAADASSRRIAIASATCADPTVSADARSAIVRATFRIRW